MDLAEHLGKTRYELLSSMPSSEIPLWKALFNIKNREQKRQQGKQQQRTRVRRGTPRGSRRSRR